MIHIRQITAAETWSLRQSVMWADKPLDYVKIENDEEGIHYGLFNEQNLISVVSLFIENKKAQFRKFATQTAFQGNGYGSRLLAYLMEEITQQDVDKIWCNARKDKTGFYKKFGMQKTSQTFIKGGIDYIIMEKTVLGKQNIRLA